jgi:dihydroorotate dehydrogenase electron transfer subunit
LFQELAPVISNHEVMPDVYLMWIDSPNIASNSRPGQFVMITCDHGQERLLRRPISIHQVRPRSLAILFSTVGAGTEWLAQRQKNEKIDLLGPVGHGFSIGPKSLNLLMVAGGMGIAPLTFLAQEGLKKDHRVRILAGARTACQICPAQLLPEGSEIIPITEDGTAGETGLVTALLSQHVPWADEVFFCGPMPMFKAVVNNYSRILKNKPVQVSLEVRMGCGLGFCYACTINTRNGLKQVCKDGPVFCMEDVIWEELR